MEGVFLKSLKEINNPLGNILHFMNVGVNENIKIGEVYFSEIYPGKVKAWKLHKKQTQRICIPIGIVKICLIDFREKSSSYKEILEYTLDRNIDYNLLVIPPGIVYGYKGLGDKISLIANAPDIPHDPNESIKVSEIDIPITNF